MQVQSGDLRSQMPGDQKNIKQKQYCNKFNKDFKNGTHTHTHTYTHTHTHTHKSQESPRQFFNSNTILPSHGPQPSCFSVLIYITSFLPSYNSTAWQPQHVFSVCLFPCSFIPQYFCFFLSSLLESS